MLLSNLKLVATVQYKPEGLHVLFYMTTTKATHMQDKHKQQVSWKNDPAMAWTAIPIPAPTL